MASKSRLEDPPLLKFPCPLEKRPFTYRQNEILEALNHAMYPPTDKTAMEAAHRIAKLRPTCDDRRLAKLPIRRAVVYVDDDGELLPGEKEFDEPEDEEIEEDDPAKGNDCINNITYTPDMIQKNWKELNSYCYELWDIVCDIATDPDATDEIQERFIKVLQFLVKEKGYFPGGEANFTWEWLPKLSEHMLDVWRAPHINDGLIRPELVKGFHNECSFFARLAGTGLMEMPFFGYGLLVEGLEENWEFQGDLDTPEYALHVSNHECILLGVSRWMAHAPKVFYGWASCDEQETGGAKNSLYDGPGRMCPQRWHFWISRLEDIAKNETSLSEEVRQSAMEAAQNMKKAEAEEDERLREDERLGVKSS